MSLNLTQISLESVKNCIINTIPTRGGTLSYATACIGIDAVNASSVQCYNISATIDSTCNSILQTGINVNVGFACSNTCQVSLPITNSLPSSSLVSPPSSISASATTTATFSGLAEVSDAPSPVRHPVFSTNPPFRVATYTLANTATNIYPSFIIITFCIIFLFFVRK